MACQIPPPSKIVSRLQLVELYRVAIRAGRVLLQRVADQAFWFTPGGRIEVGETSAEALMRDALETKNKAVMLLDMAPDRAREWLVTQLSKPRGSRSMPTN